MGSRPSRRLLPLLLLAPLAGCGDGEGGTSFDAAPRPPALRGPDAVPLELAGALLLGYGASAEAPPEIVVGRLPSDLPFEVPAPGGAEPLGALVRGSGGTIVYRVDGDPAEALRGYAAALRGDGWREPPMHTRGGFQPREVNRPMHLCGEGNRTLTVLASPGGGHLRVDYGVSEGYSTCNPPPRRETPFDEVPMPPLFPPEGARMSGGGMGGGGGSWETSARIESRLDTEDLLAHFGRQLREAGWDAESEAAAAGIAVSRWRLRDAEGRPWDGYLLVFGGAAGNRHEVALRVVSPEEERRR